MIRACALVCFAMSAVALYGALLGAAVEFRVMCLFMVAAAACAGVSMAVGPKAAEIASDERAQASPRRSP